MKKIYTSFLFALTGLQVYSQCPMTVNIFNPFPSCSQPCNGSAVANANNGTPPYIYLWSPGGQTAALASGLCAGTHTVSVTDATPCPAVTATVTITQMPLMTISDTIIPASSCSACDGAAFITVAGGNPPYTYIWSPSGHTTSAATGLCAGNYTVTITAANGCIQTTTLTVTCPTGINNLQESDFAEIFPNPVTNQLTINSKQFTKGELEIYNVLGEKVYAEFISASHKTIDLSNQSNGIYFLHIKTGQARPDEPFGRGTISKKLIINK